MIPLVFNCENFWMHTKVNRAYYDGHPYIRFSNYQCFPHLTCLNVHFFQIHILFLKLRYNSSFRFILCLDSHSETHSRFFFFKILNTLILDYFISLFRNMACCLHKNYWCPSLWFLHIFCPYLSSVVGRLYLPFLPF